METFSQIFERAAKRHGGAASLNEKAADHYGKHGDAPMTDDRWLSEFTKRIFQAGFNWQVVENKWDGFEDAFWSFDLDRCARLDMDDMEALTSDTRIVRNPRKIKSVPINAQMLIDMRTSQGSVDNFIRSWPQSDYIGLLAYLNKHGSNLGASTASYALRFSGVPSFILSKDVTAALIQAGVIDKPATSKGAQKAVQEAFNIWTKDSEQDLSYVSRVLALSTDG